MINKFNSFNIKFISHIENYDTIILIDEASNLNLDYDYIDMKFDVETCKPLIPSTDWRISYDDQCDFEHLQSKYTSTGSIINEEQHEAFLQAPVSDQNPELQDFWRIILAFRTHTKGQ